MTVPFMPGWIVHWYGNVPVALNVCENIAFWAIVAGLTSSVPVVDITLWLVTSLFATVEPVLT